MKISWLLILAVIFTGPTLAGTSCPKHYLAKREPMIVAPLDGQMIELCYAEYAVLYSMRTRTPLYSVEHLTPAQMKGAEAIHRDRSFQFYRDHNINEYDSAHPDDYAHSGYDKGHMSPAGDFSTKEAQRQSFSLVNAVPQSPVINRGIWSEIEAAVRDAAEKGDVYVVTGPIFIGSARYVGDRVMIPSHVFKAIYAPKTRSVGAYIVGNGDDSTYYTVSIRQLTAMAGIDVFPGIPDSIKAAIMPLPAPIKHKRFWANGDSTQEGR